MLAFSAPLLQYVARRKQLIFLKVILPFFMVGFVLHQLSSLHDPDEDSFSMKSGLLSEKAVKLIKLRRQRQEALIKNRDEFLDAAIAETRYREVNLARRKQNFREYHDEILEADDQRRVPGMGDEGKKSVVPAKFKKQANLRIAQEGVNRILSDFMPLNRTLPDSRHPKCQKVKYNISTLPTMSIVIVFKDDPLSVVLRMLHGIFDRSPDHLLEEVVLVDDFSKNRDLQDKMERYIATRLPLEKIRLIKMEHPAGLAKSRLIGAHVCIGQVIVFMDSHCEVNIEWAEPLLQRIKQNKKTVVTPVLDVVNYETLEYNFDHDGTFPVGGFKWSGQPNWINIPAKEHKKKGLHLPVKSPVIGGGMFAIDRKYFWKMGSFDSGMKSWGGESLEMSFRIWQCGGTIETVPCSRVGHMFRPKRPYKFKPEDAFYNILRLANVWMDKYLDTMQKYVPFERSYGDITSRKGFRMRKYCNNFKWYLDNVYPDKFKLQKDSKLYGQVVNGKKQYCLDFKGNVEENYKLEVHPCELESYRTQEHFLSKTGQLRRETACAKVIGEEVIMAMCDGLKSESAYRWEYNPSSKQFSNPFSGKCLAIKKKHSGSTEYDVKMEWCKSNKPEQQWTFVPGSIK